MTDVAVERIVFGLITLPFVIFAFLRIFVRENRLVDETFIERARSELDTLRAQLDALHLRLDAKDIQIETLQTQLREERRRYHILEEEVFALKAKLGEQ